MRMRHEDAIPSYNAKINANESFLTHWRILNLARVSFFYVNNSNPNQLIWCQCLCEVDMNRFCVLPRKQHHVSVKIGNVIFCFYPNPCDNIMSCMWKWKHKNFIIIKTSWRSGCSNEQLVKKNRCRWTNFTVLRSSSGKNNMLTWALRHQSKPKNVW